MKKILIISNGHGEDLVAAELIKQLPKYLEIDAFPMVGSGKAFNSLPVQLVGPLKNLPGGGFSLRNILALPQDLFGGYLGALYEQWKTINRLAGKYQLCVAIGDLVPLYAAIKTKTPVIFVGVNKTDYYQSFGLRYNIWEKALLKKTKFSFVRDKLTAQNLNRSGINAMYVGNPLMDCIMPVAAQHSGLSGPTIGFLPGTREQDLKLNIEDFHPISLALLKLNSNFKFLIATGAKELPDNFENRPFAEVINDSDIIIGLSGTGNEQAVGSGKPVVAFPGRGSQYTKHFARAQKQLLGEALCLVDKKRAAAAAWSILNDHVRYQQMSKAGKQRMGQPGAIAKIAASINKDWL